MPCQYFVLTNDIIEHVFPNIFISHIITLAMHTYVYTLHNNYVYHIFALGLLKAVAEKYQNALH